MSSSQEASSSSSSEVVDAAAAASAVIDRRRAIQSIMADTSLTDLERRLRVQRLMDGSSNSSSNSSNVVDGAVEARPSTAAVASLCPPAPPSSNAATTTTTTTAATAKSGGNNTNNNNNGDNHHGDVPPCVHYERKCDIVAPCCHRPYGCRICHDEMSPACGTMDRFAISVIMCRRCKRRQCSKTNECESCRASFAEYHCPKCNLWMSTDKDPFHCELCGICRVGGRENYRHCDTCCMCVSASVYDTHSCIPDKYKNNCPVCREDMFSSRQPPQDLPCGHAIHVNCFRNLAGFDRRCPICKKTVMSRESMRSAWDARARDIRAQPMPPDLARAVDVLCNDCGARSGGRDWHFLGVRCPSCASFNTVVERAVPPGDRGGGGGQGAGPGT